MKDPRDSVAAPRNGASFVARLRRVPRRNLVLVLLLPVLVVLWLPLLGGKGKRSAARSDVPADAPAAPAAPAAEAAAPLNPIAAAAALDEQLQRLVAPYRARWSASADPAPFRAPTIVTAETVAHADAALVPTAIVLGAGQTPLAIIGGRVCRPGDSIDGRSVLAIEERRVLFREGNKTFAVSLPEPTLGGAHD